MKNDGLTQEEHGHGPSLYYGYIIVALSFIIITTALGVRYAFGVFFLPLLNEFGWTRAMTSGAFSLSIIIEGMLSMVMGMLTDRIGPRVAIVISGLCLGVGYLLMSQINSVLQMYLFYGIIIGAGMGGVMVTLLSTVARWFTTRRGMMSGIVLTGSGFGALIASPIANQLIAVYTWRTAYLIIGGAILVVILTAAQFLKRDPTKTKQAHYSRTGTKESQPMPEITGFTFNKAAGTRQFWLIFGLDFLYGFFEFAIVVHIAPHATGLGNSATTAAAILSVFGALQIVGRIALGTSADILGSRKTFIIGFLLSTVVLFLLIPITQTWGLFVLAAVFGITAGGIGPLVSIVIAELFGLRSHGLLLGITVMGFAIGAATGPLLSGYLFDVTGNYQMAFLVCGVASIIGVVLSVLLAPVRDKTVAV